MKVCVAIPALNEKEFIGQLIESIKQQSYKKVEIVVIDDGSTDRTIEIAEKKGAIVLQNNPGRRGPAFGWNRTARQTKAEIMLILGADFFLEDKDYIKNSIKRFNEKTIAVCNSYHTIQDTWVEKALTQEVGVSFEPRFVRTKEFLEAGGFPEIGMGEDRVFVERLQKLARAKGMEIVLEKKAFFSGHGVHSITEMYKQAKWYGQTSPAFIAEYLKETGAAKTFLMLLQTFLRPIYFLLFLLFLIGIAFPKHFFVGIPFIVIFAFLILKSVIDTLKEKSAFKIARPFLFLIFGAGMIHGLLKNFSGNKKMGA